MASADSNDAHLTVSTLAGIDFSMTSNYELLKPVGKGAYGLVVSANRKSASSGGAITKVAVKKISNVLADLVDAKRVLRELLITKHLRAHENIVTLIDVQVSQRRPGAKDDLYIATELFPTDLHRVVYSKNVKLSDDHVRFFLWKLIAACKWMHSAGVVHRDLKPSNLLVNSECDLRVCDFGLARGLRSEKGTSAMDEAADDQDSLASPVEATMTEYVVTRWYRAPEILLGSQQYTAAVDMWSVGCIFAEMISRKPLFPGDNSLDQVCKIMKVLGKPGEDALAAASKPAVKWIAKQPDITPTPLREVVPDASDSALDLLRRLLHFSPKERCTAQEALEHPYLADYHDVDDEPSCPNMFTFNFEEHELEEERLQFLIRQQASFVGTVPEGGSPGRK